MTLYHGTYLFASRQIDGKCPVVVGDWPCCLPANHTPLECQYFDSVNSRRLGVVPAPNSISMHDPVADVRLPVVPRSELPDEQGPEEPRQLPDPERDETSVPDEPAPAAVVDDDLTAREEWRKRRPGFVYSNGLRFEPPPG